MNKTDIAWTEFSWNVWSGCEKVSSGCKFCYAKTLAEKWGGAAFPNGFNLTIREHKITEPLKLKKPALIFVNSMSDFFWEVAPDELRDRMVDVMERTPHHQYQILTKRPEEMVRYTKRRKLPLNCWLGVTVEHQNFVNRIDMLRETDVEIRFISAEPLLSPLTLNLEGIHWVIVGGESGNQLLKPEICAKRSLADYDFKTKQWTPRRDRYHWITEIRDHCVQAGVAFFFKQWGGATPKCAGNLLDGRNWEEFPRLSNGKYAFELLKHKTMKQIEQVETLEEYELTAPESSELINLEEIIDRELKAFFKIGHALLSIRDKRLYRATHSTFEDYCAERWGFTDERARLLMRGSEVVTNIQQTPTIVGVLPTNENQVRELAKLTPEQQRAAWQESVDTAPNGKVTGTHVKVIAQKYKTQITSIDDELAAPAEATPPEILADDTGIGNDQLSPAVIAPRTRIENDFYPTATRLTEILLEQVDITGRVVEPCAGDGAIAKLIPGCITNDPNKHPEFICNYNLNAILRETWEELTKEGIDWAVTNPPFTLAPQIIPLAFEHVRVGLAALLRLSYLEPCMEKETSRRGQWLQSNADHLSNIIVFSDPRPQFRSDTSNSDKVTVAWFVWRKDWSWKRMGVHCPFNFVCGWEK